MTKSKTAGPRMKQAEARQESDEELEQDSKSITNIVDFIRRPRREPQPRDMIESNQISQFRYLSFTLVLTVCLFIRADASPLLYSAGFSPSAAGASSFLSAGAADSPEGSASDEVHRVYRVSASTPDDIETKLTRLSRRSCMIRVESL